MFKSKSNTSIHFIGIGGIGMSGIAEILVSLGHNVSGSDIATNANTLRLKEKGAKIFIGHQKENIENVSVVVYSSAISKDNAEYRYARRKKIPLIRRAEMLSELMRLKYGIAVAGSHGKTTTTSMLATILHGCDIDPTHVIGGVVSNLGGHAKVGDGDYLVAEADESDGTFLLLSPVLSAITNIDNDHLDFYQTQRKLKKAFLDFANKIPFYGCCSLNIHDENIAEILPKMKKPYCTFGVEGKKDFEEADYQAQNIKYSETGTKFDLFYKNEFVTCVELKILGEHNVLNSLAAISIAHKMELSFEAIAKSIQDFIGVDRRFEKLYDQDGVQIIDDYGHHPTEILETIKTAKKLNKDKLIVVFEPHRYSRTKLCWQEFLHAFNGADEVYLFDIYPASEEPIPGVTSSQLMSDINKLHPSLVNKLANPKELFEKIKSEKSGNTCFLTLGAGSIGRNIREIVKEL